jgi:hypothetical protein
MGVKAILVLNSVPRHEETRESGDITPGIVTLALNKCK